MYVADLHIHSRFSRACSTALTIPNLAEWAKIKGIDLMGTGDFLHPLWFSELKSSLVEGEDGFLTFPGSQVKFVPTVEIATIYNHKGKNRRIHNLIFLPNLDAVLKLQQVLSSKNAKLASDGRPIIGMSSKELLQIALEVDEKAILIPAHAWTPWFGVFGSESGYDCLEECFEDLTQYIYGIETGLSSDPAMNWRVKELDNRSILSFSDAHSLPNLGRELTVFEGSLDNGYVGLFEAIKNNKIKETIEFYPEEGKYHFTGHRNCDIKYSPEDTKLNGTICPVCGRGLTVGVMERVEAVATRPSDEVVLGRPPYRMLVPLLQIISEAFKVGTSSQKVINEYKRIISILGPELAILSEISIDEIAKITGSKIAEGIQKVRNGDLVIDPGYDGIYGVVKIWGDEESENSDLQMSLF